MSQGHFSVRCKVVENGNSEIKKREYIPTPEQIAEETKKIREEWREKQQQKDWKGTQRFLPRKVYRVHLDKDNLDI